MTVKGRCTGCDLANVTPLTMPWREVNGMLQPVFSQGASQLSLELSAAAYDLDVDSWRNAGWHDFSYLVDNTLLTGQAINGMGKMGAFDDYFRYLAHARIQRNNPISQIRGALRQRESSDTCKALIMLHDAPGNRFIVAIGFMGTGKRIYDWFSNFRLEKEESVHKGFLQLIREFEENLDKIQFPETAAVLGFRQLTLFDILERCRKPGSPFHIWLAGHSQGGALVQLAAYREINRGLLRQNLIGYGFASPSVLYDPPKMDTAGIPVFHVINGDDLAPRLGARMHIGKCMVYLPDDLMRKECYQDAWKDTLFMEMIYHFRGIRDARTGLLWMIAFFHALEALPDAETVTVLSNMLGKLLPERLINLLGGKMDQFLRFSIRHMEHTYLQICDDSTIPQGQIELLCKQISLLIEKRGVREFVKVLLQVFSVPHKLRSADSQAGTASYQYIVNKKYHQLQKRIWGGASPYCVKRRYFK